MAQSHFTSITFQLVKRLSVGATIVKDNRIIAGGYNGSVAGEVHCIDEGCLIEDGHCIRTIHAEMNALLQCAKQGVSTERCNNLCYSFSMPKLYKVNYSSRYKAYLLCRRLS